MYKIIPILFLSSLLVACGGDSSSSGNDTPSSNTKNESSNTTDNKSIVGFWEITKDVDYIEFTSQTQAYKYYKGKGQDCYKKSTFRLNNTGGYNYKVTWVEGNKSFNTQIYRNGELLVENVTKKDGTTSTKNYSQGDKTKVISKLCS